MRLRSGVWLVAAVSLLAAGARAEPARLQLYVMPDTQSWAWNQGGSTLETWRSVAKALCRERERFAMVLHTGDLVDNHRIRPVEWSNALSVMRELDACRLRYAIAFGNHDFDNYPAAKGARLAGDAGWKRVIAQLAQRPAERSPSGRGGLHPLADGWFVLAAELSGGKPELDWIARVIEARPGARFVFLNHGCVNMNGVAGEACRRIFERHPEIRIAVAGHWLGGRRDAWHAVPRASGPPLLALYQNYQHVPELAAWGVVLELDPVSGAACVWSENLLTGKRGRPAASSEQLGPIAAGASRRCFDPGEAASTPG